jgi:hypothetical protein
MLSDMARHTTAKTSRFVNRNRKTRLNAEKKCNTLRDNPKKDPQHLRKYILGEKI